MAGQGLVSIGDNQWLVLVAVDEDEISTGLSNVVGIPEGSGMLFDLGYSQPVHVTTGYMLFPLDVVFIGEDLAVTGVSLGVYPGTDVYGEGRFFLEVNAGEAAGVNVGDHAGIEILVIATTSSSMAETISAMVPLLFMVPMIGMMKSLFSAGMGVSVPQRDVTLTAMGQVTTREMNNIIRRVHRLPRYIGARARALLVADILMDELGPERAETFIRAAHEREDLTDTEYYELMGGIRLPRVSGAELTQVSTDLFADSAQSCTDSLESAGIRTEVTRAFYGAWERAHKGG